MQDTINLAWRGLLSTCLPQQSHRPFDSQQSNTNVLMLDAPAYGRMCLPSPGPKFEECIPVWRNSKHCRPTGHVIQGMRASVVSRMAVSTSITDELLN